MSCFLSLHLLVAWVFSIASCVSWLHLFNSLQSIEHGLNAPEAASSKHYFIQLRRVISDANYRVLVQVLVSVYELYFIWGILVIVLQLLVTVFALNTCLVALLISRGLIVGMIGGLKGRERVGEGGKEDEPKEKQCRRCSFFHEPLEINLCFLKLSIQ